VQFVGSYYIVNKVTRSYISGSLSGAGERSGVL